MVVHPQYRRFGIGTKLKEIAYNIMISYGSRALISQSHGKHVARERQDEKFAMTEFWRGEDKRRLKPEVSDRSSRYAMKVVPWKEYLKMRFMRPYYSLKRRYIYKPPASRK